MVKKDNAAILAARQKANELRKKEARSERLRRLGIQLIVLVSVLAVVGVIGVVIYNAAQDAQTVHTPEASTSVTVGGASGVPFVVAGESVRVGAEEAPIQLAIYEDFSCPHCQAYEAEVGDTLAQLVASGAAAVEFNPINIVSRYGQRAGSAATCVAVNDPQSWWQARADLFEVHDATSDAWSNGQLRDYLASKGVANQEALDCVANGRYANWITENTAAAREAGVSGTPTLFVNGQQTDPLSSEGLLALLAQLEPAAEG